MTEAHLQFEEPKDVRPLTIAPMLVSLFLVLVVFFIILNSISKPDTAKHDTVLDSVSYAFSSGVTKPKVRAISASEEAAINQFFKDLQRTVASLTKIEDISFMRDGNIVGFSIPTSKLFAKGDIKLKPEGEDFIAQLTGALFTWMPAMRLETELVMGTKPPALFTGGNDLDRGGILRSGNLARAFINQGVEPKALAIGMSQNNPDRITVTFIIRSIELSRVAPLLKPEEAPASTQQEAPAP